MPLAVVSLSFLAELTAVFGAVAAVAYLCHRLRLVPIVGFLVTGVVLGPDALAWIEDAELIAQLAEVGVILLLFTIGLEFHLEKLLRIRRYITLGGGLQVGVTGGLATGVGLLAGLNVTQAVFTGMLLALSSTAIVVKLLADRRSTDTPKGRISLGILIFQDLAVIGMVVILPVMSPQGTAEGIAATLLPLLWASLLVGGVLVLARRAMPALLDGVAQSQSHELLLLTVIALCLGTTYLAYLAGVSLALGAFLAGLMVSESRYRAHILGEMLPLQIVFSAIFFVSMGMLLDLDVLSAHLPALLSLSVAVAGGKALVATGSVLALGYPARIAIPTGFSLSQIGEFSFVLAQAGLAAGLLPFGSELGYPLLVGVAVLLMIVTPFLETAGQKLAEAITRRRRGPGRVEGVAGRPARETESASIAAGGDVEPPLEDHVILAGYGPAGRRVASVLQQVGIPLAVIEMNPALAERARVDGLRAHVGDASRRHVLEEAGVRTAKMFVLTINETTMLDRIVQTCRILNPTAQVIVRTRFVETTPDLMASGADVVIPEEMETTVRIFGEVLRAYRIPENEIRRHAGEIRAEGYEALREPMSEAHRMVLEGFDEEGLHTRAVRVLSGSEAAGRTLGELQLRRRYQLTVLAVRRAGETVGNPGGDFRIEADDRLVLVGSSDQFTRCAGLFRSA